MLVRMLPVIDQENLMKYLFQRRPYGMGFHGIILILKVGVEGKDVIANNGEEYTCRLLTGADANPATNRHGMGSEWNSLLYRVHNEIVDENNGDNKQVGDNWANMSDKEVGVNYEVAFNGSFSWCQEHYRAATIRVFRGYFSVSSATTIPRILTMGGGLSL